MTWFAFKNDGDVYNLNGFAEKELAATFAHGYGTMQQALAHPNNPASAAQASLLATFVAAASSPAGGGVQGVVQIVTVDSKGKQTGTISPSNNPVSNTVPGAGNVLSGLSDIGQLFHRLTEANTWIRAAKILAGSTLLIVGLAHITGTEQALNTAVNAAGRVPVPGLKLAANGVRAVSSKARSGGGTLAAKTRAGSIQSVRHAARGG